MKLRELISELSPELRRDGEIILAKLLRVEVPEIPLLLENEIPEEVEEKFRQLIEERKKGVPTAYLIWEWEFYGRTFKVEPGVLVPRPETEVLVERVLEEIPPEKDVTGFEVGTGTGCISVTLLCERPCLKMKGSDISQKAVELTLKNAEFHGVGERLEVRRGSLFDPFGEVKADFIVSNPPYIPSEMWQRLPTEVKVEGYESVIGGKEGYELIKALIERSGEILVGGGFVALEVGHDQANVVKQLMESSGFSKVKIFRDYSGVERVVIGWS